MIITITVNKNKIHGGEYKYSPHGQGDHNRPLTRSARSSLSEEADALVVLTFQPSMYATQLHHSHPLPSWSVGPVASTEESGIVNRQDLEESPLSCVGICRTLVFPHIVADDLIRTSRAAREIGINHF